MRAPNHPPGHDTPEGSSRDDHLHLRIFFRKTFIIKTPYKSQNLEHLECILSKQDVFYLNNECLTEKNSQVQQPSCILGYQMKFPFLLHSCCEMNDVFVLG